MKIGYQGIVGSYSQRVAGLLADSAGIFDAEYVPLVSSANVAKALINGTVDYGVMAVYNSIGGDVAETAEALKTADFRKMTAIVMPIHQCVYKLSTMVVDSEIKKIASHIQALKQTKNSIKKYFPDASIIEVEDTATAAKMLSEGVLDRKTAVICSREAGIAYNLAQMYENIEDDSSNQTMFVLYSLK